MVCFQPRRRIFILNQSKHVKFLILRCRRAFCRCFACSPTGFRALRPLFCLIPDNCPKNSLIPDVLMAIPHPTYPRAKCDRDFRGSFQELSKIQTYDVDVLLVKIIQYGCKKRKQETFSLKFTHRGFIPLTGKQMEHGVGIIPCYLLKKSTNRNCDIHR